MKVQTQHLAFNIPSHKKESYIACIKDVFASYPEIIVHIDAPITSQGMFLSIRFTTRDKAKLTIVLHIIVKFMLLQIKLEDLVVQKFITTYDIMFVRNMFIVSIDGGLPLTYDQMQNMLEGKSPTLIH